jgi:hypothetical protein
MDDAITITIIALGVALLCIACLLIATRRKP